MTRLHSLVLAVLATACARGEPTEECAQIGRSELFATSFEGGEATVAIEGDWQIIGDAYAFHGSHYAYLGEGGSGTLRIVEPVAPRGRRVALGFFMKNYTDSSSGSLAVRASTDNGVTWRDSETPPPSLDHGRTDAWSYAEATFALAASGEQVLFAIEAINPNRSDQYSAWLKIDALRVIDLEACADELVTDLLPPMCESNVRTRIYGNWFEDDDWPMSFSGEMTRSDNGVPAPYSGSCTAHLAVSTTPVSGEFRTATPLFSAGDYIIVGFQIQNDSLASGTLEVLVSDDSGVSWDHQVVLPLELSVDRMNWTYFEQMVQLSASSSNLVVKVAAIDVVGTSSSGSVLAFEDLLIYELRSCD